MDWESESPMASFTAFAAQRHTSGLTKAVVACKPSSFAACYRVHLAAAAQGQVEGALRSTKRCTSPRKHRRAQGTAALHPRLRLETNNILKPYLRCLCIHLGMNGPLSSSCEGIGKEHLLFRTDLAERQAGAGQTASGLQLFAQCVMQGAA